MPLLVVFANMNACFGRRNNHLYRPLDVVHTHMLNAKDMVPVAVTTMRLSIGAHASRRLGPRAQLRPVGTGLWTVA